MLGGRTPAAFFLSARMRYLRSMNATRPFSSEAIAIDECDLVYRVAKQDAKALAELYELTVSRVYAVVMRVLRHAADAEEVISDVYLQVWDKAGSFESERGSVMAWLNTMAWSRAVDKLRKTKRDYLHQSVHPEEPEITYTQCEDLNAEQMAEAWSSAKAIKKALQGLSEIQQKVLQLAYTQDLSHQDIANALDLPLGTVKSHCRRGLAALREVLLVQDK
jgi:RNA polymerase sigma-70 factor, ECF subfamily